VVELERRRRDLVRAIESGFPDYADLVSPRPAGLEQARKALRAREALISIVSAEDRTFAWAVAHDGKFAFRASMLGAGEFDGLVAMLRGAI
jgi:hypothetical protein